MANLTQLKMLEGLDGFLLVDKPVGIAFSTVVKTVKRKWKFTYPPAKRIKANGRTFFDA